MRTLTSSSRKRFACRHIQESMRQKGARPHSSAARALYRLKESGFLWQQILQHALEALGLRQVPGVEFGMPIHGWLSHVLLRH